MIEAIVSDVFDKTGQTWKVDGQPHQPTEDDVLKVLDAAAAKLYDEPVGSRLETGGMLIEKMPQGHAVYVYCGEYD